MEIRKMRDIFKRLGIANSLLMLAVIVIVVLTGYMAIKAKAAEQVSGNLYYYSLSGTAPYCRLVEVQGGTIWDDNNSALSATATWTDTDLALTTKMTTIGGWLFTVPTAIPNGEYDLLLYDVSTAAGSRANTDAVSVGKRVRIMDGQIKVMADL